MNSILDDMINWILTNYKEILEFLNAIAAPAAALATFITVREMRKSRKDSINPDLYIEQHSISHDAQGVDSPYFYFLKEENKFNLYNLGNGPAKDIKITWENNVVSRVNRLGFKAIVKKNTDYLLIKYSQRSFLFNELSKGRELNLNFVLGREKSTSGFLIDVNAMELLYLESMYRFHKSNDRVTTFEIVPDDNSIVRIEYIDPLNKKRIERFNVTTKVTVFRGGESNLIDHIMYNFYFQRTKNGSRFKLKKRK